MTDYRIYRRASTVGYDGTTPETATYSVARFLRTTDEDGGVGLFSAANLGRADVMSRVRVVADAVSGGDLYAVISPTGTTRSTGALLTAGSAWLVLQPGDSLSITSATAREIDIVVNDLDDAQLAEYATAEEFRGSSGSSSGYSEQNVTTIGGTIAAWSGRCTVFVNLTGDGPVNLPAIADVAIGDVLHLVRIGGAGVPTLTTDAVSDEVNGETAADQRAYPLRSAGESVTYVRVSGGWQRDQGTNTREPEVVVADVTLAPVVEGFAAVVQGAATQQNAALPALSDCKEGAGFLLMATSDATTQVVTPDGTDQINELNATRRFYYRQPALLVSTADQGWAMIGGFDQEDPPAQALNTSTVLTPWSGTRSLLFAGGAGQAFTLPAWASCGRQTKLLFHNNSANSVNLTPPGAELIDNANSAIAITAGQKAVLYRDSRTSNWILIVSA